ncbi:MAG: DUF4159 domain-containing protein, partial [Planctomycetota bacterium]
DDPRDAATLTRWLARNLETPLTWQIVDSGSVESSVKDAPILYLSGHQAPELSELEGEVLRDYVLSGGTIVAVACCSRPQFINGAQALFDQLFPRLRRSVLEPDHPVWSMLYRLEPDEQMVGYSDGCRTRIFLATRGICCAWHQNLYDKYERLFRLGANLLHYTTNRTRPRSVARGLRTGRIAGISRPGGAHGPPAADPLAPAGPGPHSAARPAVVTVGRVKHDGDYWTDPYALEVLSQELARACGVQIRETESVDLQSDHLGHFDLLWLTGHTLPLPDGDRLVALKAYLEAGGTLVATACCGRSAFDEAFVEMMDRMYGPGGLVSIEAEDPLITGRFAPAPAGPLQTVVADALGSHMHRPHMRRSRHARFAPTTLPASQPGQSAGITGQRHRPDVPLLKGVRLSVPGQTKQRWAVIYSPIDIHCGCDGHSHRADARADKPRP